MQQQKTKLPERVWPLPHPMSDSDFVKLCCDNGVQEGQRRVLRQLLDELVRCSRVLLTDIKERGTPSYHRRDCLKQVDHIRHVQKWLEALNSFESRREWLLYSPPPAIEAIANAAVYRLSDLVEPHLLTPLVGFGPPNKHKREWADSVIRENALDVLLMVLGRLEAILTDAAADIARHTPRGGPQPYKVGPFFLMNVAGAYSLIGKKPAKNIDGPFGDFACAVVVGVGWDTSWVGSHIRSAVAEWGHRAKKARQPARR